MQVNNYFANELNQEQVREFNLIGRLERIRTAVKAFAELHLSSRPRDFIKFRFTESKI